LQFDCGGQQRVDESCIPVMLPAAVTAAHRNDGVDEGVGVGGVGVGDSPFSADLSYVKRMLAAVTDDCLAVTCPLEQRWTAASSSALSPAVIDAFSAPTATDATTMATTTTTATVTTTATAAVAVSCGDVHDAALFRRSLAHDFDVVFDADGREVSGDCGGVDGDGDGAAAAPLLVFSWVGIMAYLPSLTHTVTHNSAAFTRAQTIVYDAIDGVDDADDDADAVRALHCARRRAATQLMFDAAVAVAVHPLARPFKAREHWAKLEPTALLSTAVPPLREQYAALAAFDTQRRACDPHNVLLGQRVAAMLADHTDTGGGGSSGGGGGGGCGGLGTALCLGALHAVAFFALVS
jgi:hypothetical protein